MLRVRRRTCRRGHRLRGNPRRQAYAPLDGKVEVVEVFGYTCIHCAHFQPAVGAWQKKQPSYVRFTPLPAAFGGYWMPYRAPIMPRPSCACWQDP